MINEAATFVYRKRLLSLLKIVRQLIYNMSKTHSVVTCREGSHPGIKPAWAARRRSSDHPPQCLYYGRI